VQLGHSSLYDALKKTGAEASVFFRIWRGPVVDQLIKPG